MENQIYRETLASLYTQYLAELSAFSSVYRYAKPENIIDAYEESRGASVRLIFSDGEPSGFASWRDPGKTVSGADIFIDDIYILPEKRRNGLALSEVKKITSEKKILGVYVLPSNLPAMRFWEKTGQAFSSEKTSDGMFFYRIKMRG